MKKVLVMLILFFATSTITKEAAAQPRHAKAGGKYNKHYKQSWKRGNYYYYPSANVYYSPVARRYWYPRSGVWVSASALPPSIVVYQQPRYVVYRDMDDDIWRDNRRHARIYRPARTGVSVHINARF